jgi:hypothetical protein
LALASCSQQDAGPQAAIAGTWLFAKDMPDGGQMQSTTRVAANGHYVSHLQTLSSNRISRMVTFEGIFEVKDGCLIDTITKDSQTNAAPVPRTDRARIIRMDDREMVVRYQGKDEEVVFRKQKR